MHKNVHNYYMANINLSLATICAQREKRKSLLLSPPQRVETKNPYLMYPGYSQNDFNMRRKAEILQYNKLASQSNPKLTRAKKWSQLVSPNITSKNAFNDTILYQNDGSGNYIPFVVKYPNTYTITQQLIGYDVFENPRYMDVYTIVPGILPTPCPTNIPIPTSSSGVPGPIINLYLDDTVPLVYYNKNTDAYGIINPTNNSPWTTVIKNNVFFSDRVNNLFMNLVINNSIDYYAYTFTIKTPVTIYFTATVDTDIPDGLINLPNNSISVQDIKIITFYNGNVVTYQKTPVLSIAHDQTINFDISLNKQYVTNITYDNNGLAINNSYYNNTITGSFYLGELTISDFYLLTAPSYIYDIDLNFSLLVNMNSQFSSYFTALTVGIKCNVDSNEKIARNINMTNSNVYPLTSFQFSGI
jgi:hypothetical protein